MKRDMRNADTVEVVDDALAGLIWERVKHLVVDTVEVEGEEDEFEMGLKGTWKACGINPVLLFGRYGEGCHFSPHTDGNNVVDFNTRSLYTVLIYLNTCKDGGKVSVCPPIVRLILGHISKVIHSPFTSDCFCSR